MRRNRMRLGVIGLLTMAVAVVTFGAGAAQAAKVTAKAGGGAVPPAIEDPFGTSVPVPFVQELKMKGKKVKGTKVTDVNVTVNAFGNGPGANAELTAVLVDPRGDANTPVDPKGGSVALPIPRIGNSMLNLLFKDQSLFVPCNPFDEPRFNCNYLQGASEGGGLGTMTGELNAAISSQFEDRRAKGTWKLIWRDGDSDDVTSTVGTTKLTLKVKPRRRR